MDNLVLLFIILLITPTANGLSIDGSCHIAYSWGGAPAIFKSPKCNSVVEDVKSLKNLTATKCNFATREGHLTYREDHMTCGLVKLPIIGRDGTKDEAKVDVLAIFDGHGGAEASEMANQKFLDYFITHIIGGGIKEAEIVLDTELSASQIELPAAEAENESPQDLLKKALMHAIHDIDMEFSFEAYEKRYYGGSTATTVVLLLNDEEILVDSLGDSPAILCKGLKYLFSEKLTRDHRPDEEDERARIEAVGGFVEGLAVPRVNGRLAVSRAIGDISFKFGVIAEPKVKGWRSLTREDAYLVIASDGIFKWLTPMSVCKIIEVGGTSTSSLSERIVKAALKKGSMDNLSAAVLPLRQPSRSQPSKD